MTGDPIERLREADPVRNGGHAPAYEDVKAWIEHQSLVRPRRRMSRPRWLQAVTPVLAVAVASAVVAVVLITVGAHHRHAPGSPSPSGNAQADGVVPAPTSLLPPRGGMRGLVYAVTVNGTGQTLHLSFVQCANCSGDVTPPDQRQVNWSADSHDGGRRWRIGHARVLLIAFGLALQQGNDVWEPGYGPHTGDPGFYVSHDGGRSYQRVSSPASASGVVTVGGGQAWALGVRCVPHRCRSSVLHGPSAGSRLTRTATAPPGLPTRRAPGRLLVAGSGARAYVAEGTGPSLYATDDGGQTWSREPYPCPAGAVIADLSPGTPSGLWVTCVSIRRSDDSTSIARYSSDGGAHWQTPDPAYRRAEELVAISSQVAWSVGSGGVLARTTDGGRSWHTVLRGVGTALKIGAEPALDIESGTAATVVSIATAARSATHNRRADLVAYRTTDGGLHWSHTVIGLPRG